MVSAVSEFSPIRVDIRIILREGCKDNTKLEITDGTIAPPSSPKEQVRNKSKRNEKHQKHPIKRELHSLRLNTPKLHSQDYISTKSRFAELPKKLPQIAWKSPELERDSSASSDTSKKVNYQVNNLQQPDHVDDQVLNEQGRSLSPKRENFSISPFSERRASRVAKKLSAWEKCSSIQPPGKGYFKGKPALTPFTRLGCYRMQTSKSKLLFLSKPSEEEKEARCSTADIPRPATTFQCKQRPYSQIPLKSNRKYHHYSQYLSSSRGNRNDKYQEVLSKFNKSEAQFDTQLEDGTPSSTDIHKAKTKNVKSAEASMSTSKVPEPEVTRTRSNATNKSSVKSDDDIKIPKVTHATKLQVKQNYTFTAPFHERPPKFNTAKASVRKIIPKPSKKQDYHLKKDTVIFYRRNTSKVQLSPFRRTMKINQSSTGILPPSTNTSVYIFD